MKKRLLVDLKVAAAKYGVSIYQLCIATGISQTTLYRLSNNQTSHIKFEIFEALMNVLGCELTDLIKTIEVNDEEEENESETKTQED